MNVFGVSVIFFLRHKSLVVVNKQCYRKTCRGPAERPLVKSLVNLRSRSEHESIECHTISCALLKGGLTASVNLLAVILSQIPTSQKTKICFLFFLSKTVIPQKFYLLNRIMQRVHSEEGNGNESWYLMKYYS